MKGSERLRQGHRRPGSQRKGQRTGQKHEAVGGEKAAGVASTIFTLAAWSNRAQDLTSGAQGPCWLAGTGWLLAGAPGPDAPPAGLRGGGPCLTGCLSDHIQLTRCIVHSGALPVCLAGAARLSPGAHVWAGYGGGGGGFAPSSDDERVWFPVLALFKEEEQKEDEEEEEQEGGKRWLIKIKTSTKKGKKIKSFSLKRP